MTPLGTRALIVAIGAAATAPATAADIDALVQLLSPANLAQNLAAVCTAQDEFFLDATRGEHGNMHALAQHVKEEVIDGLSPEEADRVLRRAANAARNAALMAIRLLSAPTPQEEKIRLQTWCEETAKPFVRAIVGDHARRHELLDQALRNAKRDRSSK